MVTTVEAGGIEPPSEREDRRNLNWSAVVRRAESRMPNSGRVALGNLESPSDLERFRNAFWLLDRHCRSGVPCDDARCGSEDMITLSKS